MDFSFSAEQLALRDAAATLLAARLPAATVNQIADSTSGTDLDVLRAIASMGFFDPDLSFLDQAVLFEEAGAYLLPAPWFAFAALGHPFLNQADSGLDLSDPDRCRLTVAWAEDGVGSLDVVEMTSTRLDAAGLVTGRKRDVMDLVGATDVLVTALDQNDELCLVAISLAHLGVNVHALDTLDATRRLGALDLDHVPGRRLAVPGPLSGRELQSRFRAALACEAVGVARTALGMGVEHAISREQFGRPIGTYQGVAHSLSHAFKDLEMARSLAYRAAWSVEQGVADLPGHREVVLAAVIAASQASMRACSSTIQVLGGLGMTWEHPAHRWYKRALQIVALVGSVPEMEAEIAAGVLRQADA